jgi:hypothetical protein
VFFMGAGFASWQQSTPSQNPQENVGACTSLRRM